jgi:ribosome maturation factor RimP
LIEGTREVSSSYNKDHCADGVKTAALIEYRPIMISKQELQNWIEEYLKGTDYELVTLNVSAENDILVEVDRLTGVDVDFCAELNRYLVEKLEEGGLDYSLEVGSVSLTDPFKTKMQYEKNLGHDVEVLVSTKGQSAKYKGQLVSVDEETFSVDCEEKVAVEGKKRKETRIVTHTWRYDEPKYVKYDLKF